MCTIFELADKIEGFTTVITSVTLGVVGSNEIDTAVKYTELNLRMVKLNDLTAGLACTVMFNEHTSVGCEYHTEAARSIAGLAVIAEYSVTEGQLSDMVIVAVDRQGKALPDYKATKYTLAFSFDYTV